MKLKIECPNGCGELGDLSPVDRRLHCDECHASFKTSEVLDPLNDEKQSEELHALAVDLFDGMDAQECIGAMMKTFDNFGQKIKASWLREKASELMKIVREVEGATGVKLARIQYGGLMSNIIFWESDDGPDDDPVPEPEPSSPDKKRIPA